MPSPYILLDSSTTRLPLTFRSSHPAAMDVDSHAQAPDDSKLVRGFWKLPSELRNAVYEELLVTDCAFRLGYVVAFVSSTNTVLIFTKSPWAVLSRASTGDLSQYPPHVLCDTLRSHSHTVRKQQLLSWYVR